MREAKRVATVLGTITVCLFSGLFVASNTAPNVNSSSNVEIVEPASEELAFAAEQTSVSTTTAIVTTTTSTTTDNITLTTTAPETTAAAETTAEPVEVTEAVPAEAPAETPEPVQAEPVIEQEEEAPEEEPEEDTEPDTEEEADEEEDASDEEEAEAAEEDTEAENEEETENEDEEEQESDDELPVSEEDFIVLCNIVGHEAGSCWISEYDKAKVVEVVMNRVNSPLFPDTITEVLIQPGQFTGSQNYAFLGDYCGFVSEQVINAVKLYFEEPESFDQGYLYFWGDGIQNHFH